MASNVLTAGFVRYGTGVYEYGQIGRDGIDTNGNGKPEVDCSALVGSALKDAGYTVPTGSFTTRTLFTGETLTSYATQNFDAISPENAAAKNGSLQIGDIIMFNGVGKNVGTQHVGIFYGYDGKGNPMFYGSQSSTGPAVVTIRESIKTGDSYWDRTGDNPTDGFEITGALRPKESAYDATKDTTLSLIQTTGNGYTSTTPGSVTSAADSSGGLHYYPFDNPDANGRLYDNGVLYRKDKVTGDEFWGSSRVSYGRQAC